MSKDRSSLWMQTFQSFISFYFSEGHISILYSINYTKPYMNAPIYTKRIRLIDNLYSVNNCMLWNKPINFSIFQSKSTFNRFSISFRTISLSKPHDFIISMPLLMTKLLQTLTCRGKQAHKQLIIWRGTQLCLHLMSSHVSFDYIVKF